MRPATQLPQQHHFEPKDHSMNMRLFPFSLMLLTLVAAGWLPANGQTPASADQPVLIQMDGVPLPDAIRNLARQAGMNLILDPVLTGSSVDANGKFYQPPTVTKRLENITARAAMEEILKGHKLVLIENPATTVFRITFADRGAKPVKAAQVTGDTNKINPLFIMDDVPLADAVRQLATAAGLKVVLDDNLSGVPDSTGRRMPQPFVSFRWEKLSAAQALAALLDAYDLQMRLAADGETYRISTKPKPDSKTGSPKPAQNPSAGK
jgi:hypothetical protein